MSEKLCIFCKHMGIADDRGGGSTMTGPWGAKGPACELGHFSQYETDAIDDMTEYRKLILQAETCSDYEQVTP